MKNKISIIVMTSFILCAATFARADDSAILQNDSAAQEQTLSDEQVEAILANEGVPLTTTPGDMGNNFDINLDNESTSTYTLGVNDIIEVVVMRHGEVSGQYIINAEGKIQYEFVGDVPIEGLTKQEVTDLLTEKLSKYIISPEVNVKIAGYNSKVVYVVGEVGRPGKIFMRGDTITVREALVQAGLPLLSAKTGDGRLITPTSDGHPKHQKVNVQKLIYEGDLRENFVMKPGDTLYVPPTFFAKALRAIQPVAAPIGSAAGAGRTLTTGF